MYKCVVFACVCIVYGLSAVAATAMCVHVWNIALCIPKLRNGILRHTFLLHLCKNVCVLVVLVSRCVNEEVSFIYIYLFSHSNLNATTLSFTIILVCACAYTTFTHTFTLKLTHTNIYTCSLRCTSY